MNPLFKFEPVIEDFSRKKMDAFRKRVRREKPSDDDFKNAYKNNRKYLKWRKRNILKLSDGEIYDILKAGAYALKKDMPKFLGHETDTYDTKDLEKFLSYNVYSLKNSDNRFKKVRYGLKFLDSFTRKYYTNVLDHTGGALHDDYISLFEVCGISLHLATNETVMGTRRYFSTYTHASTKNRLQFASNFNPLIAAYIFNQYGLKSADSRGSKTICLHSSSEGWLGRLLASYYVAVRNPDYKIVYRSIDPNIKVVKAFNKLVSYLNKNYPVKNWDTEILHQGSEEPWDYKEGIDCSFTSPPYMDLEKYPDTYIFHLTNGKTYMVSELDKVPTDKGRIYPKDITIGDTIKRKGFVKRIGMTNQCSTLYTSKDAWNYKFALPTFKNIKKNMHEGGYLVWNVANIKKHSTMEEDSVTMAKDVGFKLEETLKYPLIRKPGASGVRTEKGENVRLADVKRNWEPIFVFVADVK